MLGTVSEKVSQVHVTQNQEVQQSTSSDTPKKVKKVYSITSISSEIDEFKEYFVNLKKEAQNAIESTSFKEIQSKAKLFVENKKKDFLQFNKLNNLMIDLDHMKQDQKEIYDLNEQGRNLIRECNRLLSRADGLKHTLEKIVSETNEEQIFILYKQVFNNENL